MVNTDWRQDLLNVADLVRDFVPRPLCLSFTWAGDGSGQADVVVVTEPEAAAWDHVAAAELDAHCVGHGRAGQTEVLIVTASDVYEQHLASTPGLVTL